MLDNIPLELRLLPNWVCWRYESRKGAKPTKIPISPVTGRGADSTDPSTWTTFNLALEYRNDHNLDGLGFMFGNSDYMGIDLDATTDESIRAFHDQVEARLCSYTEFSVGGIGRHIVLKETIPEGRKKKEWAIELYAESRFFCMTGNITTPIPRPISSPNGELSSLWTYLFSNSTNTPALVQVIDGPQIYDDPTILERLARAANADVIRPLWEGDLSRHNNDHSVADLALMVHIGFYTKNRAQIERLFLMSVLGQREKAKRPDYIERTITKALQLLQQDEGQPVSIAPSAFVTSNEEDKEELELEEDEKPAMWEWPPGLVGEIASFVYWAAPRPVQEVALAAGLGLMSGICGRQWNVSSTGLNHYILILAKTGIGKEAARSGIDRLMNIVEGKVQGSEGFKGPGSIASGIALRKYLHKDPCFVSFMGEFGQKLKEMCNPHANTALQSLKSEMLELYNVSGKDDWLGQRVYSKKEDNVPKINAPAFSLLGDSTPETFYSILDEARIEEGLLPRFTIMEYTGSRPKDNKNRHLVPSVDLIDKLVKLTQYTIWATREKIFIDVTFDDEANKAQDDFNNLADSRCNASDNNLFRDLWSRAHMKAMKLAAILAVGENPWEPRISRANFEWASTLVKRDIERIETRFKTGRTGPEDSDLNQMRLVIDTMRKFARNRDGSRTEKLMRSDGIVPMSFIAQRTVNYAAFKNDHRSKATEALKRVIASLVQQGRIELISPVDVKNRYAFTGLCYRLTKDI